LSCSPAIARILALVLIFFCFTPLHRAGAAESALTDAQKKEIQAMIHDYLVNKPEVTIEGLNNYQKNRDQDEQRQFKDNMTKYKDKMTSKDTPFGGNPNGAKTVVEFFDYNCGYCKHAVEDIISLIKQDKDVKVYFKDMPILSHSSEDAARWALAAGRQGKYYDFHVALMHSSGSRDKETFKKIGGDLGLDVAKMEKDAEGDKTIREQIEGNLQAARDLGIHGTPGFIIGDTLYPGYMGLDNMKKAVADSYTPKKK
jgi:protein-disulfide isomerase